MKPYPKYKPSGVEWLGDVPEGWQIVDLKHVCRVFPSNVDKHSHPDEIPVRLCNYTDVYYNDRIDSSLDFMSATATPQEVEKFRLRLGDVLFTKDSESADDIGIAAIVVQELSGVICGYHLSIARPNDGIDGHFIKAFFDSRSAKAHFEVSANGLTRVGLGQYAIDNLQLALPPLPEQRAIAGFLDREVAKIDALVAEQRRLIALLAEKRQAVISHAVTCGLNPTAPLKPSGIDWLGDIPEGWEVVPLKYLTAPGRDIMYGIVLPGPNVEEGVPIVKGGDVKGHRLKLELLNRTTREIEAPFARARLKPRDIVYSIRGTIGDAELVPDELENANITQDVARVSPAPEVDSDWLLFVLRSKPIFAQLEPRSLGAAVRGINIFDLKRAQIPVPPAPEQSQIARYLLTATEGFDALTDTALTAIALLQERRAALISAAVTGKIDVRDLVSQETKAA